VNASGNRGELGAFGHLQIIIPLQIQPQVWGAAEKQAEPQRYTIRDAQVPIHNGANLSSRYAQCQGKFVRANQLWSREILQQNLAGMNGRQ
jgi:hypothetical protein